MKRPLCLFLSIFILLPTALNAQVTERYWQYRARLDAQFLVVGEGQGYSVPAAYRNPLTSIIKWSDATVDHGWYLGVLATEHYLLRESGRFPDYPDGSYDFDDNTEALYYALKALQRLDLNAETSFLLCFGLPQENGFFIRDDAPAAFHAHFPGMSGVLSDYLSLNIYDKEMSQDQMYHLLLGLSLVKKCVLPNATYNGESLQALAIDIAKRIVRHVAVYSNWTIRNPACDKVVDRGPDAWSLAYGTNAALKYITGAATEYDNQLVVQVNQAVWPAIADVNNPIHWNSDNTHMTMALGAMGKLWNNATLQKLMGMSNLQNFHLYPLMHVALYGPENVNAWETYREDLNNTVTTMLLDAPDTGPASPQPLAGTHSWGSNNRFIREKAKHINGSSGTVGQQYNGLDYLLLHNLHRMVFACPEVSFSPLNEPVCFAKTDIDLSPYGNPAGGTFSGPGVLAGQFFNPSQAGLGTHELSYTHTSGGGCSTTALRIVTVDVCTGINAGLIEDCSFFPNPTATSAAIRFSLEQPLIMGWTVVNIKGGIVFTAPEKRLGVGHHSYTLDLGHLSTGAYVIQMHSEGKTVHQVRFMVQ